MGRWLLMPVLCMFSFFFRVHSNAESDALNAFRSNLTDPNNVLITWDPTLENPCTWKRITCNNDNEVTRIDLGDAQLSGQLAPQLSEIPKLQYLELYNNSLNGQIPAVLGSLMNLVSLDLYNNKLSGSIPDELGNLLKLRFLRLHNNTLSGAIPMSLTTIYTLQLLDLSFNNLSGIVPVNGSFDFFNETSFLGNPYLNIDTPSSSPPTIHERAGISYRGAIAGSIAAALFLFAVFTATLVWWRRRKHQIDISDEEKFEDRLGQQLTRFSLEELQAATSHFNPENVVGVGGFGKVYKGRLADGSLVAVKRLKDVRCKVEELQFQTEVEMISMAVHRNIIHLRGFCMASTEKLLVYPFMANGSVASCLRVSHGSQSLLDWQKRKRIALGSARGLAYLHHQCDPIVIHRDVKAANILVDDEFEAVVGDFGLAKLMGLNATHVTTAIRGTIGHIAPEYLSGGICSEKTDVFGYGGMLLELVSGQKATDLARVAIEDGRMLHEWVNGLVKDKNLERLVDPIFLGKYKEEEAEELIQIALLCMHNDHIRRPTMLQVLEMLQGHGLGERWEEYWDTQEPNHALPPTSGWILDSTSSLLPDVLSGPR